MSRTPEPMPNRRSSPEPYERRGIGNVFSWMRPSSAVTIAGFDVWKVQEKNYVRGLKNSARKMSPPAFAWSRTSRGSTIFNDLLCRLFVSSTNFRSPLPGKNGWTGWSNSLQLPSGSRRWSCPSWRNCGRWAASVQSHLMKFGKLFRTA